MTLAAITIRPPWSWAIAEAAALTALGITPKLVENRGQRIADRHIGQRIAIHAGQTWCTVGERDSHINEAWHEFANAIDLRKPNPKLAAIGDTRTGYVGRLQPSPHLWMDCGAVVAVATLTGCHQADQSNDVFTCCWPWGQREYVSPSKVGPAWHLVLADVQRLAEPVPCRGQVRVPWELPEAAADAVHAQLDAVVAR
ncbi:hypothetical protein QQG74_09895 [Micromonospora sp. FIMYZ51]|uniref:hypothetical protein n=1 Tax=Micromonospora sp. FIMYZ51 TaxID=3051832 RepID=UPI00311E7890